MKNLKNISIALLLMLFFSYAIGAKSDNIEVPGFGRVADPIDLGLSVKWANWNVGASKVEDYGGLYGAGDPTGLQISTSYSDYHYYDVTNSSICGTKYDIARTKWGSNWRMPTSAELKELAEKCTWVHNVMRDGIKGSVATGPNGKTMFFPYSGIRNGTSAEHFNTHASLWSGEQSNENYSHGYKDLDINIFNTGEQRMDGSDCYYGQSVRPVYVENGTSIEGSGTEISVTTIIEDSEAQPIYAGGYISNYVKDKVIKKGIIISASPDDMVISEDTQFEEADMFLHIVVWGADRPENIRFIDCTNTNEEQFSCALQYLMGNTDYYVKAFAVDKNNNIIYGGTEKIHTQNYNRYDGPAAYGNVWYAFQYTLFDVVTDEIIDPNNGFYYSTNENPTTVKYQKGTNYNTCYKFATEWNYRLWFYHNDIHCDKNKIVSLPVMKYENGKLVISKAEADKDKDITFYYSINGDGSRPENFTQIYSEPLNVDKNSIVYCYAISSDGYISHTNRFVVGDFCDNRPIEYTLNFDTNGGSPIEDITQDAGTDITSPEEPTKEGYTFIGWEPEIPETMPVGGLTCVAQWQVNSYALKYIIDGLEYKTDSIAYGIELTPEPAPIKEGYTFSGWSEIPNTMPAEDVTVTGSFTINQYLLTYILEGEEYKSYEIDFNTALTPEPVPTKKGMTFSGWGDVPETMPAHDVTLTGSYTWSKEVVDGVVYQVADTLSNYASVVGYEGTGEEVTILSDVLIGEDVYAVNNIAENALPKTTTIYVSVGRLLLWLWTNGYEDIRDTDSGRCLPAPEISLEGKTASSLSLSYENDYPQFSETITLQGSPVEKGKKGYDLALTGLEPDKLYEGLATLTLTYEEASYSKSFSFKTEPLTLTTQQPKIISLGNVIVAATSNLDDAEMNVGFEWRRTDWTDDFASNFGKAYLYKGTMEGYIRNLYIEKLWKYRPYYESNDGNRYYGNWVGIDPTNTSYFMPTVHTYSRIDLTGNLAKIWGYVMRGTDNITMQGFIYWSISSTSSSRRNANGIPSDATKVLATGNVMSATLEDLDYDTEYCYMAFVTTSEGETFYGEPQTFKTSFDPDGIENVMASEEVTEVARYNIQGRVISKPQKGINIIRFSDGTTRKVIVKQ